jgi:hypothetical protein
MDFHGCLALFLQIRVKPGQIVLAAVYDDRVQIGAVVPEKALGMYVVIALDKHFQRIGAYFHKPDGAVAPVDSRDGEDPASKKGNRSAVYRVHLGRLNRGAALGIKADKPSQRRIGRKNTHGQEVVCRRWGGRSRLGGFGAGGFASTAGIRRGYVLALYHGLLIPGDFFPFPLGFPGLLLCSGFRGGGFLSALFLGLFPLGQLFFLPPGFFPLPCQFFFPLFGFSLLFFQLFLPPSGFFLLLPGFFPAYLSRLGILLSLPLPFLGLFPLSLDLLLLLFVPPLFLFDTLPLGRRFFLTPFYVFFFFGNGFPL